MGRMDFGGLSQHFRFFSFSLIISRFPNLFESSNTAYTLIDATIILNIVFCWQLEYCIYSGHASTFLELKDHDILTEIHFHIIKTVMVSLLLSLYIYHTIYIYILNIQQIIN